MGYTILLSSIGSFWNKMDRHCKCQALFYIGKSCLTVAVCGGFYAISENIFTLWPVYWAIGCSASTLSSGMRFPVKMVYISAATLVIQMIIIFLFGRRIQTGQNDHDDCTSGVYHIEDGI